MTDLRAESVSDRASVLRGRLVDRLVTDCSIVAKQVEAAVRVVPRHRFASAVTLERGVARDSVPHQARRAGHQDSAVSAPGIQAMLLEQAGLRPGMRCLEIGSGGYNAALMAEIAGRDGEVTTVDIDPGIVNTAMTYLTETGHGRVNVVGGDGDRGDTPTTPVRPDRCEVGASDIPGVG